MHKRVLASIDFFYTDETAKLDFKAAMLKHEIEEAKLRLLNAILQSIEIEAVHERDYEKRAIKTTLVARI